MLNKPGAYAESKIDISKGMYLGDGIDMRSGTSEIESVYIPWGDLNSHFMCFGTTRMGKTRLMIFMMRQIIEKNEHLFLIDPKGSEDQEVASWLIQYASEFDGIKDIVYWSPERPDDSIKMNLLYGQSDEEATSTVLEAMKVEDEFYEDIANEILMTVLPALSFYEETVDSMVIDIIHRTEYLKVVRGDHVNRYNRRMLGSRYEPDIHDYKPAIKKEMQEEAELMGEESVNRIKSAHKMVESIYENAEGCVPIRKFITFRDLSQFTSHDNITKLYEAIQERYEYAKTENMSSDIVERGKRAVTELKKLSTRDPGYFSKVSTSYAVTMTRLSTGNVGRLLCDSKINILKDRFRNKDKRILFLAQPFPMKYAKAADMSIKMLMSMLNGLMGDVGVSGIKNHRRTSVMIDEAGSIANRMMLSLANKGGGLGLSLYLYSQSFADYKDALGEEGATILADNHNSKGFFAVNDDKSASTISDIIGGKKKGDVTYGSSEGETSRLQNRAVEEVLVPPSMVMQIPKMNYVLKVSGKAYMMDAPFQRDPYLSVFFEDDNREDEVERVNAFIDKQKNTESY